MRRTIHNTSALCKRIQTLSSAFIHIIGHLNAYRKFSGAHISQIPNAIWSTTNVEAPVNSNLPHLYISYRFNAPFWCSRKFNEKFWMHFGLLFVRQTLKWDNAAIISQILPLFVFIDYHRKMLNAPLYHKIQTKLSCFCFGFEPSAVSHVPINIDAKVQCLGQGSRVKLVLGESI